MAQVVDDPLHGEVCSSASGGCTNAGDNGTNTPIQQVGSTPIQNFGFSASGGQPPISGTLTLDVLVPNTVTLGTFLSPGVTGSSITGTASVVLFANGFGVGLNDWTAVGVEGTNPTLAAFLQNGTTNPDMNLSAYLPSTRALELAAGQTQATGFFVFQLSGLGPFSNIPQPSATGQVLPDIFSLSRVLPGGSYIVASLVGTDGNGAINIGTANSAALFVTPAAAVPEAATWAMMLLGFIGLAFAFRSRRRIAGFA
jgi:hypothetical protein